MDGLCERWYDDWVLDRQLIWKKSHITYTDIKSRHAKWLVIMTWIHIYRHEIALYNYISDMNITVAIFKIGYIKINSTKSRIYT